MVDGLLEGARVGHSGVLVLEGEAGVGKTALLQHALGSVSDMTAIRAAGVESEMEQAFAALHQLCRARCSSGSSGSRDRGAMPLRPRSG